MRDQEKPALQRLEEAPSRQRAQQVQRPNGRKIPARFVGQREASMTHAQPTGVRVGWVGGVRGRSCQQGQEFGVFLRTMGSHWRILLDIS